MTILGIGTDIIEIARIRSITNRSGNRLAQRILSNNELLIWRVHQQPIRFLAKRFTVKEAAAKAFGTGIRNGLAFNQFELLNDELGKPYLRLWGRALKLAEELGVVQLHVSLMDERSYAFATVIIEN